jgi:hypothetical protein
MKELQGTAVNYNVAVQFGAELPAITPMAEVVLILTEPTYRLVGDTVGQERRVISLRFAAGAKALRSLAASVTEYADALDKLASQTTIGPP